MVKAKQPEEMQALCSACYQSVPVARTHLIPHFNEVLASYVTTYRCDGCWLKSVDETRDKLRTDGPTDLASCALFFERYGVPIAESRRGDPPEALRKRLLELVAELRAGTRRLKIGPAIPVDLSKLTQTLTSWLPPGGLNPPP